MSSDKLLSTLNLNNRETLESMIELTGGLFPEKQIKSFWELLKKTDDPTFFSEMIFHLITILNTNIDPSKPTKKADTASILETILYFTTLKEFPKDKRILRETESWSKTTSSHRINSKVLDPYLIYLYSSFRGSKVVPSLIKLTEDVLFQTSYADMLDPGFTGESVAYKFLFDPSFYLLLQVATSGRRVNEVVEEVAEMCTRVMLRAKNAENSYPIENFYLLTFLHNIFNIFAKLWVAPSKKTPSFLEYEESVEAVYQLAEKLVFFPLPIGSYANEICFFIKRFLLVPFLDNWTMTVVKESQFRFIDTEYFDHFLKNENLSICELFDGNKKCSSVCEGTPLIYLEIERNQNLYAWKSVLDLKSFNVLIQKEAEIRFVEVDDPILLAVAIIKLLENRRTLKRFSEEELGAVFSLPVSELKKAKKKILMLRHNLDEKLEEQKEEDLIKYSEDYLVDLRKSLVESGKATRAFKNNLYSNKKEVLKEVLENRLAVFSSKLIYSNFLLSLEKSHAASQMFELNLRRIYGSFINRSDDNITRRHINIMFTGSDRVIHTLVNFYGNLLDINNLKIESDPQLQKRLSEENLGFFQGGSEPVEICVYSLPLEKNPIDCYLASKDWKYGVYISNAFRTPSRLLPGIAVPGVVTSTKKSKETVIKRSHSLKSNLSPSVSPHSDRSIAMHTRTLFPEPKKAKSMDSVLRVDSEEVGTLKDLSLNPLSLESMLTHSETLDYLNTSSHDYSVTSFFRDRLKLLIEATKNSVKFCMYKAVMTIAKKHSRAKKESSTLAESDQDKGNRLSEDLDIELDIDPRLAHMDSHNLLSGKLSSKNSGFLDVYFLRQMIVRRTPKKKGGAVCTTIVQIEISQNAETTLLDNIKVKYILLLGFSLNKKSHEFLYADSKVHYNKQKEVQEASVRADTPVFFVYVFGEPTKKSSQQTTNLLKGPKAFLAERIQIKSLDKEHGLTVMSDGEYISSFEDVTVEPFWLNKEKKTPYYFHFKSFGHSC